MKSAPDSKRKLAVRLQAIGRLQAELHDCTTARLQNCRTAKLQNIL